MTDAYRAPRGANMKLIGVGGGGGNAVDTMVQAAIEDVVFLAANTDCQALEANRAGIKVQLGERLTKGLGAGADPEIGRRAAEESRDLIAESIGEADMVFVTAGMGGGTGTGAAPVVARIARELGALTIAVVTRPFNFEARKRARQAAEGLAHLRESADAVLVISNERLLELRADLPIEDAFREADSVLVEAVRGISGIVRQVGLVNPDFADLRAVMQFGGRVLMGTGVARGADRAEIAAEAAMNSPLLDDVQIDGARGVLVNVIAGPGLTLREVQRAVGAINDRVDEDAKAVFGAVIDHSLGDELRVVLVATGLPEAETRSRGGEPTARLGGSQPPRPAPLRGGGPPPGMGGAQPPRSPLLAPRTAATPPPPSRPQIFRQTPPAPVRGSFRFQEERAAADRRNEMPEEPPTLPGFGWK